MEGRIVRPRQVRYQAALRPDYEEHPFSIIADVFPPVSGPNQCRVHLHGV
jgi:hypothetical protein